MGLSQNFRFRQRVTLWIIRYKSLLLHTRCLEIWKRQPCLQIASSLNPDSIFPGLFNVICFAWGWPNRGNETRAVVSEVVFTLRGQTSKTKAVS